MELLVCTKQVPDDSVSVSLNAAGQPALDGITPVVNAFDTYALEMATRFKEAHGGSVTVLGIGNTDALTPSMRSCLSVGADRAFVVAEESDSDAAGIAHLLAQGSKKAAEAFDVIFCGSEATDTGNGQVGMFLAQELGIPVVANVLALEPVDGGLSVKQETEDGYRTFEVSCPCVVTVVKPDYEPRYPSIKSKMAARKMPVNALSAAEIEAAADKFGPAASKVQRIAVTAPAQRQAGVKIQEKDPAEAVRRAMELMAEQKLV
jgi:electron transfer flavoprotein beta subunit